MIFDPKQLRMLKARLKPSIVRTREQDGKNLRSLEGWYVIAEANRIFGFGEWDRELVESQCVHTRQAGDRYVAVYTARVRIRVRASRGMALREGSGAGEANAASPGQAHEYALKAAETDATKRALMTFGNAFGLSLYSVRDPDVRDADVRDRVPAAVNPHHANGKDGLEKLRRAALDRANKAHSPKESSGQSSGISAQSSETPPAASVDPIASKAPHVGPRQAPKPAPHQRIDKSELPFGEPRRARSREHLRIVSRQLCLVCGKARAQAHHLKYAQPSAIGRKVSDEFTVPLCSTHHRELHTYGDERVFWERLEIDPAIVAADLWSRGRPASTASAPARWPMAPSRNPIRPLLSPMADPRRPIRTPGSRRVRRFRKCCEQSPGGRTRRDDKRAQESAAGGARDP